MMVDGCENADDAADLNYEDDERGPPCTNFVPLYAEMASPKAVHKIG